MRLGFTYDLRDDYLREGYSAEEAAEFDELETIEAIDAPLIALDQARRDHNLTPADFTTLDFGESTALER